MKKCCKTEFLKPIEKDYLNDLVNSICSTYKDTQGINHIEGFNMPLEQNILTVIDKLLEIVFPGFSGRQRFSINTIAFSIGNILTDLHDELFEQLFFAFRYNCMRDKCEECDVHDLAEHAVKELMDAIPRVRQAMKLDIAAAYEGDPAAISVDEIVVSYPGIKAITIQRFAHLLYHEKVPLIPRMMTEYVHSITGIDIHPGAHLGEGLFIDHGTGVVIGETAKIGNNVKIYQGVTLGALSFPKDACGKIIKGAQRHPTIENNVTIYSGATVLGNITIGEGSIIGGNVWLTEATPAGAKVITEPPSLKIIHKK
jgi:serine O-acetyltransferase